MVVHICHPLYLCVLQPAGSEGTAVPDRGLAERRLTGCTDCGREKMRNILSTQTPSPLLPLPLDCQSQLVKDVLNVLIGVSSVTFPLNEVEQLNIRQENAFVMCVDSKKHFV